MYVQTARLQAGLEGRELQLSNGTFSKTFRNAGETKTGGCKLCFYCEEIHHAACYE